MGGEEEEEVEMRSRRRLLSEEPDYQKASSHIFMETSEDFSNVRSLSEVLSGSTLTFPSLLIDSIAGFLIVFGFRPSAKISLAMAQLNLLPWFTE